MPLLFRGEVDLGLGAAKHLYEWGHTLFPARSSWMCMSFGVCLSLFHNKDIMKKIRESQFDVVMIDMVTNEHGLALAKSLGLPVIALSANPLAILEVCKTAKKQWKQSI